MTEVLEDLLPEAVRAGVPAVEFPFWTLAEVKAQLDGYSRRQKDLRRLLNETAYNTAALTGEAFGGLRRGFHEAFPGYEEEQSRPQPPLLMQARVEAYAARRAGGEGVPQDG
jgi:hypothetical protein